MIVLHQAGHIFNDENYNLHHSNSFKMALSILTTLKICISMMNTIIRNVTVSVLTSLAYCR